MSCAWSTRWICLAIAFLALPGCSGTTPPNILLVTFDTTRYDRFGCTGDPEAREAMERVLDLDDSRQLDVSRLAVVLRESGDRPRALALATRAVRINPAAPWGSDARALVKEMEKEVLDALVSSGVLFERAYASAPLTLPSHTTMLTGLEPNQHGVHDNGQRSPGPAAAVTR